jgi:hypothetical protein
MEEGWNLSPILIPLLTLLAGWAIGFFDSNLRTSKKIRQAEESAQATVKAAENRIAEAQAKLASTAETPVTVDDPGLLRLKNENGSLTLDLDGARLNTSALTTDQRKRLIEMLNAMRPWLEGKPAAPPATVPPPSPAPAPVADTRQGTSTPIAPSPPQPVIPPPATVSKPAPSAKKKKDEPEAAPTSIVGQINLILQARIANTPLASKGVALLESATGGVNVYIGVDNKYEGVDDVPDEEVKAAIRAAIAEWEKKYTPGL